MFDGESTTGLNRGVPRLATDVVKRHKPTRQTSVAADRKASVRVEPGGGDAGGAGEEEGRRRRLLDGWMQRPP